MVQEPSLTLTERAGGRVLVNFMQLDDTQRFLGGPYQFMGLNTRPDVLEKHPETARKLARALIRASRWILENSGAATVRAAPRTSSPGATSTCSRTPSSATSATSIPATASSCLDSVQRVIDVQQQSGALEPGHTVRPEQVYTNDYVPAEAQRVALAPRRSPPAARRRRRAEDRPAAGGEELPNTRGRPLPGAGRRLLRRAGGPVRQYRRAQRLRQVHAAAARRRTRRARRRRGAPRRAAGGRCRPPPGLHLPAGRAAPLAHRVRQRGARPAHPRPAGGRGPRARGGVDRARGPPRLRALLSRAPLGRHAPARRHRPDAVLRARRNFDGRAVRPPRRADALLRRAGPAPPLRRRPADDPVRNPRSRRGDRAGRPRGGAQRGAGQPRPRGRAGAAPAPARPGRRARRAGLRGALARPVAAAFRGGPRAPDGRTDH